MFKMVNCWNNVLLNIKVFVMFFLYDKKSYYGNYLWDYYFLEFEVDKVCYFLFIWIIVYVIDENLLFYGIELEEIRMRCVEMLILLEVFDEIFFQNIIQKYFYFVDCWLEGFCFKCNFSVDDKGRIVLNIYELNELEFIFVLFVDVLEKVVEKLVVEILE